MASHNVEGKIKTDIQFSLTAQASESWANMMKIMSQRIVFVLKQCISADTEDGSKYVKKRLYPDCFLNNVRSLPANHSLTQ